MPQKLDLLMELLPHQVHREHCGGLHSQIPHELLRHPDLRTNPDHCVNRLRPVDPRGRPRGEGEGEGGGTCNHVTV